MADEFGRNLIDRLPRLRRFAIAITRSRDRADDLVQITCEKALANQSAFRSGTNMDAWLFRIMRNAWIDRARRMKTEGHPSDLDDVRYLIGQDGEAAAEARLALNETAEAIAALPDDQREVLILVCVEDLSYRQAAEALDVPIGTIMSRLARARRRLIDQLGIDMPVKRSPGKRV